MPKAASSKLLSLILRHKPEHAGLTLGPGGWVAVDDLLAGLKTLGQPLSREALHQIVDSNDKKRFTLSDDGSQIRAAQGHSVAVQMGYAAKTPPAHLFHGTARDRLDVIFAEGLKPMSRQHVHLSLDAETATRVGARHGKPVVLTVQSGAMAEVEHAFFEADNGVWLTDHVPPAYLGFAEGAA